MAVAVVLEASVFCPLPPAQCSIMHHPPPDAPLMRQTPQHRATGAAVPQLAVKQLGVDLTLT